MKNAISLVKGTSRDYLTVNYGSDEIQNARQIIDLTNDTSVLQFDLERYSRKWSYFDGDGVIATAGNREYCIFGESCIKRSRNNSGTHLNVSLKEIWYKLAKKYITAYNINIATSSEFDHIDKHMVVLAGNSKDSLFINGTKVSCPYPVGTAKYLFWCLLYNTGWSIDSKFDTYWPDGVYDLESDKKNILENIKQVKEFFGGMLLWDSANKKVALVDEVKYQEYSGFSVRYRKNIIGIERTEDRNVITRLYPYGNSHLNIADVNNSKEYIDDFTYSSEILEGIVTNSDIYSQASLLEWGKRQSKFYSNPRYTYTVDLFKFNSTDALAIPQPELGRLAKLFDEDIVGAPTLQRILKIDQNVFIEHDCKIAIGDIIRSFERKFVDTSEDAGKAGNVIDNNGKISGSIISGSSPALDKANLYWESVIEDTDRQLRTAITQTASEIRLEARDNKAALEASISLTASQIRSEVIDVRNGLQSSIAQTASEIRSEVRDVKTSLQSSITQTASQIRSEVRDVQNGLQSSITQESNRISLLVEGVGSNAKIRPAQIVASINSAGSSVLLSADKIQISGSTTFKSWVKSGTTKIDGGMIATGTLEVRDEILWGTNGTYGYIKQPSVGNTTIDTSNTLTISARTGINIRPGSTLSINNKVACGNQSNAAGLEVTGRVHATRFAVGTGTSNYGVENGTFKDVNGKTITVKGGIITKIN